MVLTAEDYRRGGLWLTIRVASRLSEQRDRMLNEMRDAGMSLGDVIRTIAEAEALIDLIAQIAGRS